MLGYLQHRKPEQNHLNKFPLCLEVVRTDFQDNIMLIAPEPVLEK